MASGMEIVREQGANEVVLKVSGHLDGYWANHLAEAIHEVVREGVHDLRLNLSQTFYVSSGGIRVLVEAYKEFVGVGGTFAVVHPSAGVKQVIDLAGLGPLLYGGTVREAVAPAEATVERTETEGWVFETYSREPSACLACRPSGRPELLPEAAFSGRECEVLTLPKDTFALGLGALGEGFAACSQRFGEFLSIAGNAACQPTDGTNYPDYLVASGTLVPKVTALYGLACRGGFRKLMRFECPPRGVPVPFSAVLAQARRHYPGTTVGLALVAESAGLLGAALKRPPVAATGNARVFQHPEIRRWLSFTPERGFTRSVAAIAGVVSEDPPPQLAPLLRPILRGDAARGHFHAAAFGYHPLPKGRIELHATMAKLFDTGGLQGVVHVLADDRPSGGGGESVFLRGACWFGPIDRFVSQEEAL